MSAGRTTDTSHEGGINGGANRPTRDRDTGKNGPNPLEWSRETWRKIAYGALITGAVVFSLGVVGLAGPAAIATMTGRVVVFFGESAEAVGGLEAGVVTVSVGAQLAGPAIATGGAAILVVGSLIDEWWRRP